MSEIIDRMAAAMEKRAAEPLGNIPTLEPVLVGCLGDAWKALAKAALEQLREATDEMAEAAARATDGPSLHMSDFHCAFITWEAMMSVALGDDHSPNAIYERVSERSRKRYP